MADLHHKTIKRFYISGEIHDDSAIGRLRIEYTRMLQQEMKDLGYAQRLDIDPDFTIKYNKHTETFTFKISLYGSYVGKKKIECVVGIDGTQVIYTQPNKSSESSQDQASTLNQK
jgi:hypothetical protein